MLSLTLLCAVLASHALADGIVEPPSFFLDSIDGIRQHQSTVKRVDQVPLNPPVCAVNVGPFWQITGGYPYEMAADLCAAYGWRLAMLTEENSRLFSQVASNCTSYSWIAGAFGLPADPCAVGWTISRDTVIAFENFSYEGCVSFSAAVMCEEIPQVTLSQTTTIFNMTIAFGQSTTTATQLSTRTVRRYTPDCSDCQKPPSCSSSSSSDCSSGYVSSSSDCSCDWSIDSSSSSSSSDCGCPQRGGRHHKMLKSALDHGEKQAKQVSPAPVCYGENCLPLCNYTYGGIHLITARVNYTDANAECAKYGWSLLDFTNGRTADLVKLSSSCSRSRPFSAFINSYNGVQSPCPYLQSSYFLAPYLPVARVTMPTNSAWCADEFELPVYCQEHCPFAVADSGSEIGEVSKITNLASTTATLFTPSTTVVKTESCTETVFVQQP